MLGINDDRQRGIHITEALVPKPDAFEVEVATVKPERHKSPELIKAGSKRIRSEVHKFINSISNKEELPEEWKESIIVPFYKKGFKQIVAIIGAYHFRQLHTKFYYCPAVKVMQKKLMGICGFRRYCSTTDHLFCIRQILEKKWE